MTDVTVTKTEMLMTRTKVAKVILFEGQYDDTQVVYRTLTLSHEDYERLGSPEEITVRIEPGDTLNP